MRDKRLAGKTDTNAIFDLRRVTRSLPADASALAWTPDGTVLAVGDQFGNIRLWNRKGIGLIKRIEAHLASINSLSWSPDGMRLASASNDGTVRIWEVQKDEPVRMAETILVTKKKGVVEVSWSPDNLNLAIAPDEGIVRIWDFGTRTWLTKLQCNADFGAHLSWSADATLLFTNRNGEIQTWRRDGRNRTIEEWNLYLLGASWSPNADRFAAGTLNGEICIWNFRKMRVEETFKISPSYVIRVSWCPTNDTLVAECSNGSILVFDVETELVKGHLDLARGTPSNLAWAPDGKSLAFGADRGLVHLYDLGSSAIVESIPTIGGLDLVTEWGDSGLQLPSVAWGPKDQLAVNLDSERLLITESNGARVIVSDISTDPLSLLSWSPDGRFLALSTEGKVLLWDASKSYVENTFYVGDEYPVALAWSPDGSQIAAGTYSGDLIVASLVTNLTKTYHISKNPINLISWAPSGNRLAINVIDEAINLWNLRTASPVTELYGSGAMITSLAWSPDGKNLASGDESGVIFVYPKSRQRDLRTLEGHAGRILSLIWSPDSEALASASDDSVKLWRARTWEVVEIFEKVPAGRTVESISFHQMSVGEFKELEDVQIHARLLDIGTVFQKHGSATAVNYTSAKVVLVGESNVGKSCLGLRLAHNEYQEQGTTHGMRTWSVSPQQIYSRFSTPANEQRDITLWDMGGQDEYRLIHQLFLHDTTLALIMLDPTRGRASFNEVEEWSLRLEKQLEGRRATKLLVGTKLDHASSLIDRMAIQKLIEKFGFLDFFETSAKTRRGISELGKAIVRAIDWSTLSKQPGYCCFRRYETRLNLRRQRDMLSCSIPI